MLMRQRSWKLTRFSNMNQNTIMTHGQHSHHRFRFHAAFPVDVIGYVRQ